MKSRQDNTKSSESINLLSGLMLIKNQWPRLALALTASMVILFLDFFLTISMPKILEQMEMVVSSGEGLNIPSDLVILILLIVIRPAIGWLINLLQIAIILTILRNLEDDIAKKSKDSYKKDESSYSSESAANLLISHGRYFVDNFLIPGIRATTDSGTIIVIALGLLLQFPLPLVIFLFFSVTSLVAYQSISKNSLSTNGEICLRCYEQIIKSSKNGFEEIHQCFNNEESHDLKRELNINQILDQKKRATIIIGSIAQGLKYVVEFCFMLGFGAACLSMIILTPNELGAFIATFAYAGVRMLPSFTSIIAFFQARSTADPAIRELITHLRR